MTVQRATILTATLAVLAAIAPVGASSDHPVLVTSAQDAGPGTFRAAIERANADPGIARVIFTG
jgi:hypothetical protein